MKYYVVYRVDNILNDSYYIGSHITDNLQDGYLGSGVAINEQIRKFGPECFVKRILKLCSNKEELRKEEKNFLMKHKGNPHCLNKLFGLNHGFDLINEMVSKGLITPGIKNKKVLYKNIDGKDYYKSFTIDQLEKAYSDGWGRKPLHKVYNDGSRLYQIRENQEYLIKELNLKPGVINYNYPMLGKKHSMETRMKMSRTANSIDENGIRKADKTGKAISKSLRKVGADGLTVHQRSARQIQSNGLTKAQNIANKQMRNGTNNFVKNNPNYIKLEDGKSIPHHTNKKRVENGTHNLLTLTKELANKGCHHSQLKWRKPNILKFLEGRSSVKINKKLYEEYITTFPDKYPKFNFEGFIYSIKYFNRKEHLDMEISNENC